jgi:hypothetical protein
MIFKLGCFLIFLFTVVSYSSASILLNGKLGCSFSKSSTDLFDIKSDPPDLVVNSAGPLAKLNCELDLKFSSGLIEFWFGVGTMSYANGISFTTYDGMLNRYITSKKDLEILSITTPIFLQINFTQTEFVCPYVEFGFIPSFVCNAMIYANNSVDNSMQQENYSYDVQSEMNSFFMMPSFGGGIRLNNSQFKYGFEIQYAFALNDIVKSTDGNLYERFPIEYSARPNYTPKYLSISFSVSYEIVKSCTK